MDDPLSSRLNQELTFERCCICFGRPYKSGDAVMAACNELNADSTAVNCTTATQNETSTDYS